MLAPSIEKRDSMCIDKKESWIDPIKAYLKNETFPEDRQQDEKIKKKLSLYYMEKDRLYKHCFLMPLLMCLNEEEFDYVLRELHEGICESHIAEISLALKALRNGYFQPMMKANGLDLVKNVTSIRNMLTYQGNPLPNNYHSLLHGHQINGESTSLAHF